MDVHTANELIRTSEPQNRFWRGPMLVLMGLSVLLGAFWANPAILPVGKTLAFLIPQCLLLAMLGVILWDARRQRRTGQLLDQAMEAVHLQDWPRAREVLGELLGSPIRRPGLRAQSLLALAVVAESDRQYEASQAICEYILHSGLGNPLQRHTAEVALGAAMLRNGQTTDAVALIDRLRPQNLPEVLKAQVELLTLFREVSMGHVDESAQRADERKDLFRSQLGTRAGYGYALLAAVFDRRHRPDAARRFWHDATLLIPPPELLRRFPELSDLAQRYPAAEYPF